jgi:hypothetical protein
MKTQVDRPSYLPLLITGIAVILLCTAGIARMMGWGPTFTGGSGGIFVPDARSATSATPVAAIPGTNPTPVTGDTRAKARCAECGVIVLMREIERQIIVRMADGSRRVIDDADPASWRPGERVIVIGGVQPSNR